MCQRWKQKGKQKISWNKNGNTTYQNLQNAAKAVHRRNIIAVNAYIKKKERYQINCLPYDPAILPMGIYSKEMKSGS